MNGTPTREQGALLATAFSSVVMKALGSASMGVSSGRVQMVASLVQDQPGATLGDGFDAAHRLLLRGYRSEYTFKNTLVSKIVFGRHSPRTASALLELGMGRSWADLVIVNGTSTTYEIKTDLDQFTRLTTQITDYTTRSEFVNVVTSDRRASAAEEVLPAHVGIVAIRANGSLTAVRAAQSNLDQLEPSHLYSMLRLGEALDVLHAVSGYELDVPRGHAWRRVRDLFSELTVEEAHGGVIRHLRKRGRNAAELATSVGFPRSLRALSYSTELSGVGRRRALDRLSSPASLVLEG